MIKLWLYLLAAALVTCGEPDSAPWCMGCDCGAHHYGQPVEGCECDCGG